MRDRAQLIAQFVVTLLLLGLATCYGLARAEPPAVEVTALRPGQPAPYAGILVPAETLRALLIAQDERDHERELRRLERERADVDLAECRGISDARERARVACEASRVPPACEPVPWGGWPWVSGVAGAALGFGVGVAVGR